MTQDVSSSASFRNQDTTNQMSRSRPYSPSQRQQRMRGHSIDLGDRCIPGEYGPNSMEPGYDEMPRKRQLPRIPFTGSQSNINRVTQELEERAKMLKLKLTFAQPDIGLPLSDSEIAQRSCSRTRRGINNCGGSAETERFDSDPEAMSQMQRHRGESDAWTTSKYGTYKGYGTNRGGGSVKSQQPPNHRDRDVYGYSGARQSYDQNLRRAQESSYAGGEAGYYKSNERDARVRGWSGEDVQDGARRERRSGGDPNRSRRVNRKGEFQPDADEMALQSDTSEISDMSISKYSVRSTQSERPSRRFANVESQSGMRYIRNKERMEPSDAIVNQAPNPARTDDRYDGSISDSALSFSLTEGRRKRRPSIGDKVASLVGFHRNKSNSTTNVAPDDAKRGRSSFSRSEETILRSSSDARNHVGRQSNHKMKLNASDNYPTDQRSGDSNGRYGDFIEGLGPSQMVGRQVLGLPCMGEIQLSIADRKGQLEVEVIRARGLIAKPGAKLLPAPYVKVYLMDGKSCVEKQKTVIARRTLDPLYQQQLCFTEPYNGRILQVTVWGDYGRSDRKVFMGVAQIQLDDLDLSSMAIGWYKLFTNSSLVSAVGSTEPTGQRSNSGVGMDNNAFRSGRS